MKTIDYEFTDKNGLYYDDLMVIKYDSLIELNNEKMHFICDSITNDGKDSESKSGVDIYQLDNTPNMAYRLYKDRKNYIHTNHEDDCKLVNLLTKKQESITLTDFPKAIIAIRNPYNFDKYHVIGTEIPFYQDYIELNSIYENIDKYTKQDLLIIYQQIINILKELKNVNLIYDDVHMKNIMIRLTDLNVKLIDFEYKRITTNGFDYNMIVNLKSVICDLSEKMGFGFDKWYKALSLDAIEKIVTKEAQKIRKR